MLVKHGSHQVVVVTGVARVGGNERIKRSKGLNVKFNSKALQPQRLTRKDRASFYKIELSIRRFATCILSSRLTIYESKISKNRDL